MQTVALLVLALHDLQAAHLDEHDPVDPERLLDALALELALGRAIARVLAFNILSSNPVPLFDLIISYGIGIYLLRIILSLFDTIFIYLAKIFLPSKLD